jgi:branched-chain amino acid transport system permease protein
MLILLSVIPLLELSYLEALFFFWFFTLSISTMWNLLTGYTGLVSLGQQMFIGLGGYTLAIATLFWRFPAFLGVALGGVVSAIFSIFLSSILLRMRGIYFTLGTMVLAEALKLWFTNWTYVKAGEGIFISSAYDISVAEVYYANFVVAIISIFLTKIIVTSKFGLGLQAIRDNEVSASISGVNIFRIKMFIFAVSALVTGLAGGTFYFYQVYIHPSTAFSFDLSLKMMLAVIIGGVGTMEGPLIGAGICVCLDQLLVNFPGTSLLIQGAIGLAMILLMPHGIMGFLKRSKSYQMFIRKFMA